MLIPSVSNFAVLSLRNISLNHAFYDVTKLQNAGFPFKSIESNRLDRIFTNKGK